MKTAEFEKKISHLTQEELLTGVVSSLNCILVDKGIIKDIEIQNELLKWMKKTGLTKRKTRIKQ
jgi:hypothetical protein